VANKSFVLIDSYLNKKRILPFFKINLFSFLPQLFTIFLSLLLFKINKQESWGIFVKILLNLSLIQTLFNFGNKDFLIKQFSSNPRKINSIWLNSFFKRIPILILTCVAYVFIYNDKTIALIFVFIVISRYINQSFDPLIIYERKFNISIISDLLLNFSLIVMFLNVKELNNFNLHIIYLSASLLKSILLSAYFYNSLSYKSYSSANFYSSAFPFFIMSLSGFLVSKIDQVCSGFILDNKSLARYQILMALLSFLQLTSANLLLPYSKNIFRMNRKSISVLKLNFRKFGIVFSFFGIILVALVLHLFYSINFKIHDWLLSFLYVYSFFIYFVNSYEITILNKQNFATLITILCGIINLIFAIFLSKKWGVSGVLLGATVANNLLAFLMIVTTNKYQSIERNSRES